MTSHSAAWWGRKASSLAFLLLLAAVWELVSRTGVVSQLYFPPMTVILSRFWDMTVSGALPAAVGMSFSRMAAGYFLAAALMIPLGAAMGLSDRVYRLFDPMVEFLRPLPPPAVIPAAMLFLGIGPSMKIFVIFFACSFPIVLNTIDGVRGVDPLYIATARTLGASRRRLVRRVVLPAALPQIMSGLRISLPISLIVAVLSEMIGSTDGIGHFILNNQRRFNIPEMYAGVMMLGLAGCLLNGLFLHVDKTALAWHKGWKQGAN